MHLSERLPEIYCLGVHALGPCPYDLANPGLSYFSIGQLATVIALLLAAAQWVKPLIRFRLSTRLLPLWISGTGIGLATVFVFTGAVLRMRPVEAVPIWGFPIVWEFLAGVSLIVSVVVLLSAALRKTALTRRNAPRFLAGFERALAIGDAPDLRDFADESLESIDRVIATCAGYQLRARANATRSHVATAQSGLEAVCHALLDLWADERYCRVLMTQRPETAIVILRAVGEHAFYERGAFALVRQLIKSGFTVEGSILYREEGHTGMRPATSFMRAAFSNPALVGSMLQPLMAWQADSPASLSAAAVRRYGDAIRIALTGAAPDQLARVVATLGDAFGHLTRTACSAAKAVSGMSEAEASGHAATQTLIACSEVLAECTETFVEYHTQDHRDSGSVSAQSARSTAADTRLTTVIGNALYEFVHSLALCSGHDLVAQRSLQPLWRSIFRATHQDCRSIREAIQDEFLSLLQKHIAGNLDPQRRQYPLLTRPLLRRGASRTHPRA